MRPTIDVVIRRSEEKPDFAFKIRGSSFEPFASDGDYLLVRRQRKVFHGDLGVFFISGKYRAMRFYSKGSRDKLIPLDIDKPEICWDSKENIICIGKVVDVKRICGE